MHGSSVDSLRAALKAHPQEDTVRVKILNELSRLYRSNKPATAQYYGMLALASAKKIGYLSGEAIALNLLGSAYFYEGQYVKADSLQNLAIQFCLKNSQVKILGSAYNSAGLSKQYQSNYIAAIDYYLKALELEEQNKNLPGQVKVMGNLGSAYRRVGDNKMALSYYLQADSVNKSLPEPKRSLGGIANNIGNYYLDYVQYDRALQYFKQGLEENKKTNNRYNIALSNSNIGFCYLQMKQPDAAAPYLEQAYQTYQTEDLASMKSMILVNMAALRFHQGKAEQALDFANQALRTSILKKEKERELLSYHALAEIYLLKGDTKKAHGFLEKAYLMNDSLRNNETTTTISNIQKGYELNKKQTAIDLLSQEAKIKSLELDQELNIKYFLYFGILALTVMSGLIGYNAVTKNKLNKALHIQNLKVENQKKIIEVINASLEEKASRAQMNPHFIFNALNSIQYLIAHKNNEEAFGYLVSFSSLLRGILEFSDRQKISLIEEIEMLTLYLQLEALRFDNTFSYDIQYEGISSESIYVPPLLLQPLVENAIVHGLPQKKHEGKLVVSFRLEGVNLVCTISDNGIGRQAAIKNRQEQKEIHTSRGMDITRSRLMVFNHSVDEPIVFEDLFDENGIAAGTLVTLKLYNVN